MADAVLTLQLRNAEEKSSQVDSAKLERDDRSAPEIRNLHKTAHD